MALDKQKLKTDIIAITDELITETDFEAAKQKFAEKLSEAIDAFVKSATINYTSGLVAPNGAVTRTFNGNLL